MQINIGANGTAADRFINHSDVAERERDNIMIRKIIQDISSGYNVQVRELIAEVKEESVGLSESEIDEEKLGLNICIPDTLKDNNYTFSGIHS
ncbi:MAG: hypothetical protein EZS28_001833 [Streblomastix strix]|uniref:Uncharacterized protein n=1 Tax=Streblomastix strix TaxID=222440 RepID=A0A5J4X5X8_9EUKA|nr:MAG: hypothetical protein EZS28_001833 [Streblomastix strix]